jgi:Domain of unknown function (DUF932)
LPATLSATDDECWRSRKIGHLSGNWDEINSILPKFQLRPFSAGEGKPPNPFLQVVTRVPSRTDDDPMPVRIVSNTYSLASHDVVAALCRQGIVEAGVSPDCLRYQLDLSELGEWMHLGIYFPDSYSFTDTYGYKFDLRLECFNSVEGSCRLLIVFGWLRFVCENGMIIGESKIEIKERHDKKLQLDSIPKRILPALKAAQADRVRLKKWQAEKVVMADIATWVNKYVTKDWAKKAAARVFHICDVGMDVDFNDPFAPGAATEKTVRYLAQVPGCPERATTKFDVSQAMSFVATRRTNIEERVALQSAIPRLLTRLKRCEKEQTMPLESYWR